MNKLILNFGGAPKCPRLTMSIREDGVWLSFLTSADKRHGASVSVAVKGLAKGPLTKKILAQWEKELRAYYAKHP